MEKVQRPTLPNEIGAAVLRCECNGDTRISYVSPAFSKLTGLSAKELTGQHVAVLRKFIHNDDRPGYVRELWSALRHDEAYTARYRLCRSDGGTLEITERGKILRDEQNNPAAIEATLNDVTRAGRATRERDTLHRLSGQIICIADFDGFITEVNPVVQKLTGWNRYEVAARPFIDFVHPEDRQRTLEQLDALRQGMPVQEFRNRWRSKSGGYRTLCWHAQPFPEERIIYAIATDETVAHDAEKALARYRLMFEQSPEEFYLADADGVITYCNEAAAGSVGLRVQDMIGMNLFALDGSDPIEMRDELIPLLVRGENETIETRHLHRNGKLVPKRMRFSLLRDDDERSVCAIGHSVEEELRETAELRESEMRFRMLAENARDLIYRYRLRPNAGFEYVNPAAERITGYTAEEHYANPLLGARLVHPDDRYLLQELQSPEHSPYEPVILRWIRKDGEVIWTEQFNRLITDRTGQVVAIEGIVRDASYGKMAEQEAQPRSSALENPYLLPHVSGHYM